MSFSLSLSPFFSFSVAFHRVCMYASQIFLWQLSYGLSQIIALKLHKFIWIQNIPLEPCACDVYACVRAFVCPFANGSILLVHLLLITGPKRAMNENGAKLQKMCERARVWACVFVCLCVSDTWFPNKIALEQTNWWQSLCYAIILDLLAHDIAKKRLSASNGGIVNNVYVSVCMCVWYVHGMPMFFLSVAQVLFFCHSIRRWASFMFVISVRFKYFDGIVDFVQNYVHEWLQQSGWCMPYVYIYFFNNAHYQFPSS